MMNLLISVFYPVAIIQLVLKT